MKNENPPRVIPQLEYIYGIVKEVACNSIANNSDPEFASLGSALSRALVKHPVMTTPYGATLYGMRDQIHEELKNQIDKGVKYKALEGETDLWPHYKS